MITGKIDITKIKGAKLLEKDGRTFLEITNAGLYKGAKGTYLDVILRETPDGEYGDWMICQSVSKQAREAGERGAILGNGKNMGGQRPAQKPAERPPAPPPSRDLAEDDPPF